MPKKEDIIPVKDLVINGVYQSWVQDIVKILKINESTQTITLYNVSGAHKQWTSFKHINLIKRFY